MASAISAAPNQQQPAPFEREAPAVVGELRAAVRGMIGQLSQSRGIDKPADLQRELSIDSKLAWQMYHLAFTANGKSLAKGASFPRLPSIRRFIEAGQHQGVSTDVIAGACAALSRLQGLIATHAGDFATFESMLTGLSAEGNELVDLAQRRAAFRANSHLWGLHVKTHLRCSLHHPGADRSLVDVASIRGMRDIRRLRSGAPFRLTGHRVSDGHLRSAQPQSIEERTSDALLGPTLLTEFCTTPTPRLDNRAEGGSVFTYLCDTPLGNTGLQTLYLSDITRGVKWASPGDQPNEHLNHVTILKPAESLVMDVLMHEDLFGPLQPEAKVFGSLDRPGEMDLQRFSEDDVLPVQLKVSRLGRGLDVLAAPQVPRYAEMVQSVCERLKWDAERFDVYRCVMEFPLLNSVVLVRFSLPDEA